MTSFTNSTGARARGRLQDSLDALQVALGATPSAMPWLDIAKATAARAVGLPKSGGLIGSTYAQFMSENAPRFLEATQRRLGLEPQVARGDGERRSGPVIAAAARAPNVAGSIVASTPSSAAQGRPGAVLNRSSEAAPLVAAATTPPAYHAARRGEGMSTIYVRPDGSEDVFSGGTMAWRNNNPGNLIYGDFAKSRGAIGVYENGHGKFAVFPDEAAGVAAMRDLMKIPKYQAKSVDEVIRAYAPPQQNDTKAYQGFVRSSVGVDGSTKLSDLTDEQFDKLIATIRKKEGSRAGSVTSRAKAGSR